MTDCHDIRDLLDAYSLGATEKSESEYIERHVTQCVRCWEELQEAQDVTLMLALAVPLREAPLALRDRVMSRAAQEVAAEPRALSGQNLMRKLKGLQPWRRSVAASVTIAGLAAIVVAGVLFARLDNVESERDGLAIALARSENILTVVTRDDVARAQVPATSPGSEALGVYYWSESAGLAVLICENLDYPAEDEVFQAWWTIDGKLISAGTFQYYDHVGTLIMDLKQAPGRPNSIGVSIEKTGGGYQPRGEMLIFGHLPR